MIIGMNTLTNRGKNLISLASRPIVYIIMKLVIGRSETCDVTLKEALSVSRQHAQFEPSPDGASWTITDLKSGNGTVVNGAKLKPRVPLILEEGDIIELGKDDRGMEPTVYVYQFCRHASQVPADPSSAQFTTPIPAHRALRIQDNNNCQSPTTLMKAKIKDLEKQYHQELETQKGQLESLQEEKLAIWEQLDSVQQQHQKLQCDRSKELLEKQEEMMKLQREKEMLGKKLEQVQQERFSVEERRQNDCKEQKKKMEGLAQEKMTLGEKLAEVQNEHQLIQQEKKKELEQAQKKLEEEQKQLEITQKAKESELGSLGAILGKVQMQYTDLLMSKRIGETKLRNELEERRRKLEENVKTKEQECKSMSTELGNVRKQVEQVQHMLNKQKSSMLSTFEDAMETELQCSICSEMFIEATSLGCSHSFCSYCIEKWMEKKKECPECRTETTSWVRSRVLDNYIEKVVDMLGDDVRDKRKTALDDRKVETEAYKKEKNDKQARAELNIPQQRPVPLRVTRWDQRGAPTGPLLPPPIVVANQLQQLGYNTQQRPQQYRTQNNLYNYLFPQNRANYQQQNQHYQGQGYYQNNY